MLRENIQTFLAELRRVNASEHTIRNYESDLEQFLAYLTPPDAEPPPVTDIDTLLIREWLGSLYEQKLSADVGSNFEVRSRQVLFETKFAYGQYHAYDVSADGQRVLINTAVLLPSGPATNARVLLDRPWQFAGLTARPSN